MIYKLYRPVYENDRVEIQKLMNLYRRLYVAVAAVIAAVIGELNEAAQIYVFAVILFPDLTGCPVKDCFLGGTDCLGDVIADPDLIRAGAGGPL